MKAHADRSPIDDVEAILRAKDPRLGALIDAVIERAGRQRFEPSTASSHFEALARSIIFQQLSGKAAATIYGRLVESLGGDVAPAPILAARDELLRAAGLSNAKVRYVRALAEAATSGELEFDTVGTLEDDAAIDALTRVAGVGVWTAQMFLCFACVAPTSSPPATSGSARGSSSPTGSDTLQRPATCGAQAPAGLPIAASPASTSGRGWT